MEAAMKPLDSDKPETGPDDRIPEGRSPSRNGGSTWPYPELDLVSLQISGFPRFAVRSRRNH
jgi:hypothetical protein